MAAFQDIPLQRKLTLLILLTTVVALLLASAGFIAFERSSFKQDLIEELATDAEMLGFNSASALSFDDASSATETLRSLNAKPHVVAACIYDREGRVFAAYPGSAAGFPSRPEGSFEHFTTDHLELYRPIRQGNETIGGIFLRYDLSALRERLIQYALIVLAVMAVATLAAYLIASRLQRVISRPISELAAIASHVATEKDYSRRATKSGSDEIGRLVEGFNEMLTQIQARDAALEKAREELGRRVEERTRELARERERFQLIFESVPVGISLLRVPRDGARSRLINDAHLRLSGLTRAEADEPGVFAHITHPEDYAVQEPLYRQLSTGEINRFSLEKRYRLPDGSLRWVAYTIDRRHEPDGSYEDLSTIVDITALKRAQEESARQQARFKFIFDSVPVGISWFVPDHEDTHLVNPAHERITGISALQSLEPGAFARVSHPDDYRRQRELTTRFIAGEIDHYSLEKRYLHPDGRIVWAVLTSRMFTDPATGTKQSVTTLVNITNLKEAQEEAARQQARFKFIFDSAPVGLAWMLVENRASRIVNPALARITGVPVERCQELDLYRDVTHPDDQSRQDELRRQLYAGAIDHYSIEKRYLHPDGVVHWGVLTVHLFREVVGETQEISTLVDITERKQAETALEDTHKQLLATSRQAGMAEVATGVLHNVGNVLNSVNVSATLVSDHIRHSKSGNVAKLAAMFTQHRTNLPDFLTKDPRGQMIPAYLGTLSESLAAEQQSCLSELENLRKNIEHIKDIVAMQQSYARTSGVFETVSVPDLIEDALRMNAGSLARHDVNLVREYRARGVITTDKHKVIQILINLVRNAKYACDESGRTDKRITVTTTADEHGVKIAVADNGVGIPAENLTRIFNHGFTTREHGHGFGLHSGALAAKELGGSLTVGSDGAGKGATFTLQLPHRSDAPPSS